MRTIDFRLIRQLWLFLAVAEEEHFGRAATRLGMSQPPLTEQIKVLEQSLRLRLFDRSRRGTRLSPSGAALLPAMRAFAAQVEQLQNTVHEIATGQKGVLRIGAITSAMLDRVPMILNDIQAAHPDSTVFVREIDSADAVHLLENGEIDLAFVRLGSQIGGDVGTLPLADERLAVALQREHRLAASGRVRLSSLEAEPFVMAARQVSPVYFDAIVNACRTHGFVPRILFEVGSIASQVAYVSCGQGVALVPISAKKVAPGNVIVRPLQEQVSVVTQAVAWNVRRHHPVVETVLSKLRTTPAESSAAQPADQTLAHSSIDGST